VQLITDTKYLAAQEETCVGQDTIREEANRSGR
jgi:hypothetical protein